MSIEAALLAAAKAVRARPTTRRGPYLISDKQLDVAIKSLTRALGDKA